jgi:perosamine synthetase
MTKSEHLREMIISQEAPIRDAMVLIDNNAKGILFVLNDDKHMCGVITDGDIRRGLLKGNSLDDQLATVMNRDFINFPEGTGYDKIANTFDKKFKYIPILDQDGKIVDFYSLTLDVRIPVASPSLSGNEAKYLMECVASNWISSQGKFVNRFEEVFADFIGSRFGVSVCNGTMALHLALETLGIGVGDEVIVPSLTFAATANAVIYTGATPVFVDSEMDTWNIDPLKIREKINKQTKAIIPVHLYGQPTKMNEIKAIANKHQLFVIEDAAEAHGAEYNGQKVGKIGDVGIFSFFGNKIITTGEGGMLVTDDEQIYNKAKILRDHGMSPDKKYWHPYVGYNYRMTNMQAAIGCAQMERVDEILAKKIQIAETYEECLGGVNNIKLPPKNEWSKNIYWMYSIVLDGEIEREGLRDRLIEQLNQKGIECRPMFYPLHQMPPYQERNSSSGLETAEYLSKNVMSLPSYIDIKLREVRYISEQLITILNSLRCE